MAADMYLIATPIFRASFTGSLKNLLDLVPVEGLMGKVCGLLAMGATDHHYLAIDGQLRPVLAWFGAHLVPGGVYLRADESGDGAGGGAGECGVDARTGTGPSGDDPERRLCADGSGGGHRGGDPEAVGYT